MKALIRLPAPVFGVILGREWFIDATRTSTSAPVIGIFQPTA